MHPVVFSAPWFRLHQRLLLSALNAPGVGRELRAGLGMSQEGRLVHVLPHCYVTRLDAMVFRADFRTHAKFAKRMRRECAPLWRILHAWDAVIADRFVPALSAGFSTLTAYPDPSPEVTTVDGYVTREGVNETWGTIRSGAGNGSAGADSDVGNGVVRMDATTTSNQWSRIRRGIFLFDTSTLGAGVDIISATFSTFGNGKSDSLGVTPNVDVYTATPATNTALASADYGQIGSTSQTGAATTYANLQAASYTDFTLSAVGMSNVVLAGITKFALQNAGFDVANLAPTWTSGAFSTYDIFFADQAGSANDPKLVVTFGSPRGWPFMHLKAGSGVSTSDQMWP